MAGAVGDDHAPAMSLRRTGRTMTATTFRTCPTTGLKIDAEAER